MTGEIEINGYEIGPKSQKVLASMADGNWTKSYSIREVVDGIDSNRQVSYRMENYLIPSGLVEEAKREEESDTRHFRLTEGGVEWVSGNLDVLERPSSVSEIRETAVEALSEAESAKDSVQKYRGKVSKIKKSVEEVEEDARDVLEDIDDRDDDLNEIRGRSKDNQEDLESVEGRIERLEWENERHATDERVGGIDSTVSALEARMSELDDERERVRARANHVARSAGYLLSCLLGALIAYLVVVVAVAFVMQSMLIGVVLAGVVGLLGALIAVFGVSRWYSDSVADFVSSLSV